MFYVYMLKCCDDSYYTGYTNDLRGRIHRHNFGKGAKYTRSRRPVHLVFYAEYNSKAEAMSNEYRIKRLSRSQKIEFIKGRLQLTD